MNDQINLAIQRAFDTEPVDELTPRELHVLGLVSLGMTDKEIASAIRVKPPSVTACCARIYRRLGLRESNGNPRVLASLYAIRAGVMPAMGE